MKIVRQTQNSARQLRATIVWPKTMAESEALEYAKRSKLDIVTICPSTVIEPMLQPSINATSSLLISIIKDGLDSVEDKDGPLVDVCEVADALLLVYEKPEAK